MKDEITLGFTLFFFGIVIGTILMANNSFVLKKENAELKKRKIRKNSKRTR